MIVNILHFHESVNIYNITQDITLTKTTPITGNFFKAAITANYIRVEVPHNDTLDNQVVPVRLGDFNEDGTALQGMVLL